MCGIIGYIGKSEATPILVDGLRKLEYRGYDSAGIALIDDNDELKVIKAEGKLTRLETKLLKENPVGTMGIGHTRWATHGEPSNENSHPHVSEKNDFAVVHNGIIENYLELKEDLIEEGVKFFSQTDTEVIVHLVDKFYAGDLEEAVYQAANSLKGSYAMCVISKKESEKIICARKDSPLIIGLGEDENFIASDIPAILKHTKKYYILNDNEFGVLTRDNVTVRNENKEVIEKKIEEINWDAEAAEKGGYEHFMLKEIHEQPEVFKKTLSGRLKAENVVFDEIKITKEDVKSWNKIFIVACGTAYHAGLVGKSIFEKTLKIPVETDIASEFRYREPLIDEKTLVIVVSQSGETADTLAALREAKNRGSKVLAITNVVGSSIAREADHVAYIMAGPEISVASTKAYTTMLITEYLLGVFFGELKGSLDREERIKIVNELREIPNYAMRVLAEEGFKKVAENLKDHEDVFYLGRGLDWAAALEGVLKLKEISYIHAEAYAAGELKHGTLALIEPGIQIIAINTQSKISEKTLSNIQEVKARGAVVTIVAKEDDKVSLKYADNVVYIPEIYDLLSPVISAIPLQLIAYYTAVARGANVDQPRNLAKSVTVE